jgi:hypothetical protein
MIIFVWFYVLDSLLCLLKMYDTFGRGSVARTRLRRGSVASEMFRNADLEGSRPYTKRSDRPETETVPSHGRKRIA